MSTTTDRIEDDESSTGRKNLRKTSKLSTVRSLDHTIQHCTYIRSNNGVQFTNNLVVILGALLDVKRLKKTAKHLQMIGLRRKYNISVVPRLRHYVVRKQRHCDEYVQPLAFTYDEKVYKFTEMTLFSHILYCNLPKPTTVSRRSELINGR